LNRLDLLLCVTWLWFDYDTSLCYGESQRIPNRISPHRYD